MFESVRPRPGRCLQSRVWRAVTLAAALAAAPALALETPIGNSQRQAGMEVAAVYLQPVPMELAGTVASDGPHYGDNVKLMGPGKYRLRLAVAAPGSASTHAHFGRHTDKETGVGPWFKPFAVEYEFTYAGIGKKGGY